MTLLDDIEQRITASELCIVATLTLLSGYTMGVVFEIVYVCNYSRSPFIVHSLYILSFIISKDVKTFAK